MAGMVLKVESLAKLHVWSLEFTKLIDLVPVVFKSEKIGVMVLWLLKYGKISPLYIFGNLPNPPPQKSDNCKIGP